MNNLEKCKKCGWEGEANECKVDIDASALRCPKCNRIVFSVRCAGCMNQDCEVPMLKRT
jgi:hypothetical protein